MNYEDRMQFIEDAVLRFQARYTPPRAMNKTAQDDTFAAVCQSINRKLPSKVTQDGLRDRLARIFEHVSDRHETNAWPLQAEYTRAVNATAASSRDVDETPSIDPVRHTAKKIRAGEPVGDFWLYGRNLAALKSVAGITDADVEPYRIGLFHSEEKMVGPVEAARRNDDRLKRDADFRRFG